MIDRFKMIKLIIGIVIILLAIIIIITLIIKPVDNNVFLLSLTGFVLIMVALFLVIITRREISNIINQIIPVFEGNYNVRAYTETKGVIAELALLINKMVKLLQENNLKYEKAERARKELLSNVSHDIRTPLTSIIGYIDAVIDGVPDNKEEEEEYLNIVSSKARSLKKLVDNLFYMTKLDADDISLDFKIHDLGEVIREVLIDFLPQIRAADMDLQVNIPDKKLPVWADRLSMIRIFNNIIQNCIQYGSDGNVLGIEVEVRDNKYGISIWDRGQGIAEEYIPRLFDRLFKGERVRGNKNSPGSGLGLTICKKLINRHHGTIEVESTPWKKTTFFITLPVSEE